MNECIDCGEPRGQSFFLWLSDKHWRSLGYQPDDYACPHCIINRYQTHDKSTYYAYLELGRGKDLNNGRK